MGAAELRWALAEPPGVSLVPELYVESLSRHATLATVDEGDVVLPGVTALLAPGRTPGHLMFVVDGASHDLLLVQDAAKYRAELVTGRADMSYDPAVTAATIARIWEIWRRKPGSVVLTGHDLPMVLQDGKPAFLGRRDAGIAAIFGDDAEDRTIFDLSRA